MKKIVIIVHLLAVSFLSYTQEIQINQSFSKDTIFNPFTSSQQCFSLKISGGISLIGDSSMVRVLLIDDKQNKYLLFEASPIISSSLNFAFQEYCDETCYLKGIIPASLEIHSTSAIISIEFLRISYETIEDIENKIITSRNLIDSIKIEQINSNLISGSMLWRAGKTHLSSLTYTEKEGMFGRKFNLYGFDYYLNGVFHGYPHHYSTPQSSDFVNEFDWRNRHSADKPSSPYYNSGTNCSGWITAPEQQDDQLCWDFATSQTLADVTNIYCNQIYNYNFSENKLLCITYPLNPTCHGGDPEDALTAIFSEGGLNIDDGCMIDKCPGGSNCYLPCNTAKVNFSSEFSYYPLYDDYIKEKLIKYGPAIGIIEFTGTPSFSHAMTLIGYRSLFAGDTIFLNREKNNFIIVDVRYNNETEWHFKDSNLHDGSYYYYFMEDNNVQLDKFIAINGPYMASNLNLEKRYTDLDNDGYFWSGTHNGIIPNYEDCDDSNKDLGPYNTDPLSGKKMYDCTDNCPDEEFTGTYEPNLAIWNINETYFNKTIIINNGRTVIVNDKLYLHPRCEIIIKKGGKLVITQNGMISSQCNKLWKGIRVLGDNNPQSSLKGRVEVYGTISDALIAIKDSSENGTYCGGIIITDGAHFINNRSSIEISNYDKPFSVSILKNTTFEADDTLTDKSIPIQFIRLTDLSLPIEIQNCSFKGTGEKRRIFGIKSNDANLICKNNSSFEYLLYGIYSSNSNLAVNPFRVEGCTFTNNFRGIYASAVTSPIIQSNNFDVPMIESNYVLVDGFTSYGVYLEMCNGYHIENNNFISTAFTDALPPAYKLSCGLYIRNSGPYANEVYRNTFEEFNHGIAAFGYNRNSTNDGLELKCNTFINNGTDIGVHRGNQTLTNNTGIKYNQGIYNAITSTGSAGNIFTDENYPNHVWDFNNKNCNKFLYNHHKIQMGIPNLVPEEELICNLEGINENTESNYYDYGSMLSCPSQLVTKDIDLLKQIIVTSRATIDSLEGILRSRVDGGNTEELNNEVLFSTPSQSLDIYNQLLNNSPFLSDSVLKSGIVKEDVFSNQMITDILSENPQSAKSDSLMSTLDQRLIPFSDTMISTIMQGKDTIGEKEEMEMSLAYYRQIYCNAFTELLNLYSRDSIISNSEDSICRLLEIDYRFRSKYILAFYLLKKGNIEDALNLLDTIPTLCHLSDFENEEYNQYLLFFQCFKRSTENQKPLSFDSIQISNLLNIISKDTLYNFVPTSLARNALISSGFYTYYEPVSFDQFLKSASSSKIESNKNKKQREKNRLLKIYPNPAYDHITVEYNLPSDTKVASLIFSDIHGRQMLIQNLDLKSNHQIISLTSISVKNIFITLYINAKKVETSKLTMQ